MTRSCFFFIHTTATFNASQRKTFWFKFLSTGYVEISNTNNNIRHYGKQILKHACLQPFLWMFTNSPAVERHLSGTSTSRSNLVATYSGLHLLTCSCNQLPQELLILRHVCVSWIYAKVTPWGGFKTFPWEAGWSDRCTKWFIGRLHSLCVNWTAFL